MLLIKLPSLLYTLNKTKFEFFYSFVLTLLISFLTYNFHANIPKIPISIPTFLGTAISILLSFKLSQSYDRWWEARKIWGTIVNESRNFTLQLQSLTNKGNDGHIKQIAFRHIAWCFCLGQSL